MKKRLAIVGATIALALSLLAPAAYGDHGTYRPPVRAAEGACSGAGIGWNTMPESLVFIIEFAFDAHVAWNCEVVDANNVRGGALVNLCGQQGLDVLHTTGDRDWVSCVEFL